MIARCIRDISDIFPVTRLYTASISTYPSGLWSFTPRVQGTGSLEVPPERSSSAGYPVLFSRIASSSFQLPRFVKELMVQKGAMRDAV